MSASKYGCLVVLLVLSSCRHGQEPAQTVSTEVSNSVLIDESSAVLPLTEELVSEYRKSSPGAVLGIKTSGTTDGLQKFCSGYSDIVAVSRPIKPAETEACLRKQVEYIELPLAYDAVVVVVNSRNTWVDYMTISELKALWNVKSQGKVMKWNEIRPTWPDRDIHLFGPDPDSGTYDYFTSAVNAAEGAGRGDYTASEDEQVLVNGISLDELGLAYFGCEYYERNKSSLKLVAIDAEDSTLKSGPVAFSPDSVLDGTYRPLSRPLFMYVNARQLNRSEVSSFVDFYLKNATKAASEIHYVPLPIHGYVLALDRLRNRTIGSVFEGKAMPAGIRIQQLVQLEETFRQP